VGLRLKNSGGKVRASALASTLVLALPVTAAAAPGRGDGGQERGFVPKGLAESAAAQPDQTFRVIVQSAGGGAEAAASAVDGARNSGRGKAKGVLKRFASIGGVAAELTGEQIQRLAARDGIFAITEDAPMVLAGDTYERDWRFVAGAPTTTARGHTAIAIIDSGIDPRADFGGRVVKEVDLTSLETDSPGDGRGHGTFVASIAAGAGTYPGVAQRAYLVSLDVVDDRGMALTSDILAAVDWILQNKDTYGIRVANFSLHSAQPSSFLYDPLDKAVEKLWFSGVVVVAAAGNYAVNGAASGVLYAPANDPFVITVGATDIRGSRVLGDDFAAPWSAFGYTPDGFAKPEVAAPGRYLVGAVPPGSTMAAEHPERIVAPGYMWMSGTSFAAPVVAGGAAHILALNPGWTPDQVKGALMAQAVGLQNAVELSIGVGQVKISGAASLDTPPNPNVALNQFIVRDPAGGSLPVFDASAWVGAAASDANWDAANWSSANWSSANWSSANWSSANWSSANWSSANWSNANWSSANWSGANWTALTWVE
jgi:serine protease AprX